MNVGIVGYGKLHREKIIEAMGKLSDEGVKIEVEEINTTVNDTLRYIECIEYKTMHKKTNRQVK